MELHVPSSWASTVASISCPECRTREGIWAVVEVSHVKLNGRTQTRLICTRCRWTAEYER